MDAEPIQATGNIAVAANTSPRPPANEPVSAAPAPETSAPAQTKDTVSLSQEGRAALEQAKTVTETGTAEATHQPAEAKTAATADQAVTTGRRFELTDSKELVVKIIDERTGKVIHQTPLPEQLRLQHAIQESLDLFTGTGGKAQ
jgi:uncharacterized FlaG/YvyC family protein